MQLKIYIIAARRSNLFPKGADNSKPSHQASRVLELGDARLLVRMLDTRAKQRTIDATGSPAGPHVETITSIYCL